MTDASVGSGPDDITLLPTVPRDSTLHRDLWKRLDAARARTTDPALREALDDVLRGRLSMRELMVVPAFGAVMAHAAEQSQKEMAQMSTADLERLRAAAANDLRSTLPKEGSDD